MPTGASIAQSGVLDVHDLNSAALCSFQLGSSTNATAAAVLLLLVDLLYQPAFDQLRTKEQLGYVVSVFPRTFAETSSLNFIVQGNANTANFFRERIFSFIAEFLKKLESMAEATFDQHKASVVASVVEKVVSVEEDASRFWSQILRPFSAPDFLWLEHLVTELQLATLESVVAFYYDFLVFNARSMSIEIYAAGTEFQRHSPPQQVVLIRDIEPLRSWQMSTSRGNS